MSLDIRYLTNGEYEIFTVRDSLQNPPSFNVYERREYIPKYVRHYADSLLKPQMCKPDLARCFGVLDLFYPNHGSCSKPDAKNRNCVAESCAALDSSEYRRVGLNKPVSCWTECPYYLSVESEKTMNLKEFYSTLSVGDKIEIDRTLDNKEGSAEGRILSLRGYGYSIPIEWELPDGGVRVSSHSVKAIAQYITIHQTYCKQCGQWLSSTAYEEVNVNKKISVRVRKTEEAAFHKSYVIGSSVCSVCLEKNAIVWNAEQKAKPVGRKRKPVSGKSEFSAVTLCMKVKDSDGKIFQVVGITPYRVILKSCDNFNKRSCTPDFFCENFTTLGNIKLRYPETQICNICEEKIWYAEAVEYYTKLWCCQKCENLRKVVFGGEHVSVPVEELDQYEDIRLAGGELFLAAHELLKDVSRGRTVKQGCTRLRNAVNGYGEAALGKGWCDGKTK
jgi:hypothetical protein